MYRTYLLAGALAVALSGTAVAQMATEFYVVQDTTHEEMHDRG